MEKNQIKNVTQLLICPFCVKEIPLVSYSISDDVIYLHINCSCVNGETTIQLEKYFDLFKEEDLKIQSCSLHEDKDASLYCTKCTNWLCHDCLIEHQAMSTLHVLFHKEINLGCQIHKEVFKSYCWDCERNICLKCKENHKSHRLDDIKKIPTASLFPGWKDMNSKVKENRILKEEMIDIIDKRVEEEELNKMKEEINTLCEQNNKINHELERLINLIRNTSEITVNNPNYAFCHISKTLKINTNTITLNKDSLEESYQLIKNHYLNNHILTICDDSNIIEEGTEDIQEPSHTKLLATLEGHTNLIKYLIQLSDGRIASSSWDFTIKLWDLKTLKLITTLEGHTYYVWSIIQLKDGRIASCSGDNTIKIWHQSLFMCMNTITGDNFSFITQLKDDHLVTCSKDSIQLWEIETFECLLNIDGHTKTIWKMIQLTDQRLVTCSWDHSIKFWDHQSLKCLGSMEEHSDSVNCIIQLKTNQLASCSDDKTIRLWEPSEMKAVTVLNGHRGWVFCLIQLNDERIVSCSNDRTIKFWDITNYHCVETIQENETSSLALIQLSDGRLASGTGDWLNNRPDGVINIWDLNCNVNI